MVNIYHANNNKAYKTRFTLKEHILGGLQKTFWDIHIQYNGFTNKSVAQMWRIKKYV